MKDKEKSRLKHSGGFCILLSQSEISISIYKKPAESRQAFCNH